MSLISCLKKAAGHISDDDKHRIAARTLALREEGFTEEAAAQKAVGEMIAEARKQLEQMVSGGQERVENSLGQPIATTPEAIENFWRWFGDSKVVDAKGEPLVVYHGTEKAGFKEFDPDRAGQNTGRSLQGIYFTESKINAATYSGTKRDAVVSNDPEFSPRYDGEPGNYAVYLKIENPYIIDFAGRNFDGVSEDDPIGDPYFHMDEVVRRAIDGGHDGVIAHDVTDEGRHGQGYGWGRDTFVAFHPDQIKSAIGNNGEFDPNSADITRSAKREDAVREAAKSVLPHLTPEERAKLRTDTAQKLVEIFKDLPSANEMAAVAYSGRAKRGWYENSAKALVHVFGPDAPRFAALLAAMSPQTSVEINLRNALNTWKNWVADGRPTNRGEIVDIMGRSVEGNKLTDSVLPAWINNSVRALTAPEIDKLVISGPKVNSFMLNLRGVTNEVTNDAWMANYAAVDQRLFAGGLNVAGTDPGKGPGYLAMSARVRQAAKTLTKLTGENWTPAEVQETVWSWAKTLYELQNTQLGALEILDNGDLTHELISATPDFRTLFHEERNEEPLRQAGYGEQLESLRSRADHAGAGNEGSATGGQAGPFAEDAQGAYERRAAGRLQRLYEDRLDAERAGRALQSPARDAGGIEAGRSAAPLAGAPAVAGARGPDARLVEVAHSYAADLGLDLKRQAFYAAADPERGARIADAYEAMSHAPQDPAVQAAYADLIAQTRAQYEALSKAGYKFYFFDESNDPYAGNPWNAMRDLRAHQRMGVFATEAGFGSDAAFDLSNNPLLADTGITWPYGSPAGEAKRVLANDLFRAVHDAFGHGLEGAGFRADGEENAWQAHVRLFHGPAVGALTSETRGQNSWLNFGPYGEHNRSAKVEDTHFADQKTGLMPAWTWTEGRVPDEIQRSAMREGYDEVSYIDRAAAGDRALAKAGLKIDEEGPWLRDEHDSDVLRKDFAIDDNGEALPLTAWFSQIPETDGRYVLQIEDREGNDIDEIVRSPARTIEVDSHRLPIVNSNGQQIVPAHDFGKLVNFWKWFGESRVVDDRGRPLVVYHGTNDDFSQFDEPGSMPGRHPSSILGIYFSSSPDVADEFVSPFGGGNLIPAYLTIKNPAVITWGEFQKRFANESTRGAEPGDVAWDRVFERAEAFKRELLAKGHDGIIVRGSKTSADPEARADNYIVFRPEQIKSAIGNDGSFSADSKEIARSAPRPAWKSQLEVAIASVPDRIATMSAPQWRLWLDANASKLGVKKEEIEWSGVKDWLAMQGKAKLTRDQVEQFVHDNGVKVQEVLLGAPKGDYTYLYSQITGNWEVRNPDGEAVNWFDDEDGAREYAQQASSRIDDQTKYDQYTVPGGSNYKEMLITLPVERSAVARNLKVVEREPGRFSATYTTPGGSELVGFGDTADEARAEALKMGARYANGGVAYQSSHWEGQPNILAHIRFDERTDATGAKVLFLNEIQSDWAQQGRKSGFELSPEERAEADALMKKADAAGGIGNLSEEEQKRAREFGSALTRSGVAPRAPFVVKTNDWVSLALKRAITYATQNGFEKVALITGDQAAALYDLSKRIAKVTYEPSSKNLRAWEHDAPHPSIVERAEPDRLPDIIGKEAAQRLLEAPLSESNDGQGNKLVHRLEGLELKLGGEGMHAFYDKIVPQVANDVLKKIGGGKVETVALAASFGNKFVATLHDGTFQQFSDNEAAHRWVEDHYGGGEVKSLESTLEQPGFSITPKMHETLEGGAPLFSPKRESTNPYDALRDADRVLVSANASEPANPAARKRDIKSAERMVAGLPQDSAAYAEHAKRLEDLRRGDAMRTAAEELRNTWDPYAGDGDITQSAVRDMALPFSYQVSDFLDSSKKVSWWDKTVGSPYHLAQKHPKTFGRVYNAVQDFIAGVSHFANRAMDLAPDILPKLEDMKDIFKSPLSAEDVSALKGPIFEGTLNYMRDREGNAVPTDDVGRAGVVWRDEELREKWHLNDAQIKLYRQFRRATNKSINDMALTSMVKYAGEDADGIKGVVLNAQNAARGAEILADHLGWLAANDPDRAHALMTTVEGVKDIADTAQGLVAKGYAPLSRYGDYTVYVTRHPEGQPEPEQVFFSMYETQAEANKVAREMREQYPDAQVTQGTMSKEAHQLFKGVTPETLALFGEALGLHESGSDQHSQVFQEYLKLARSSRSAMKRMIERKGIAGFSEDVSRVLASFVYSNARQSSMNLYSNAIAKGAADIPDQQGDLKDMAIKLGQYAMAPKDEAQALRGLLFTQYIGGSVASAMVNLTQSFTTTLPTLSQYFGAGSTARVMAQSLAIMKDGAKGDDDLAAAIKKAAEDGITDPNETHQLMAISQGRAALRTNDGTTLGKLAAKSRNSIAKTMFVWGKAFGLAESINRQIAFITAYKLARDKGMEQPYEFAKKIVADTQFTMNGGNNPMWARGPVGATLFTFKKFGLFYLENLARMWGNGPEGKKAFALSLAIMFLLAGVGGFPFHDDLEAIIDAFMQRVMNRSFSSKLLEKQYFAQLLGDAGAGFVTSGLSGLPGAPIDVSGRLGLNHLVPGIGMLTKKRDYSSDELEMLGPVGDMAKRTLQAGAALAQGDLATSAQQVMPQAVQNALKMKDMLDSGGYRDSKGRFVVRTTPTEAVLKGIGFQPASVHSLQEAAGLAQNLVDQNQVRHQEILDLWTRGRVDKDPTLVEDAKRQLADWNRENPDSPLKIDQAVINKKVQQAMQDKAKRLAQAAPKAIRQEVRGILQPAPQE